VREFSMAFRRTSRLKPVERGIRSVRWVTCGGERVGQNIALDG